MRIPDQLGETCAADGCQAAAEIAGWCPACAIARYRTQAVRPTPKRWLNSTRPKCGVDGCRAYAVRCRRHTSAPTGPPRN